MPNQQNITHTILILDSNEKITLNQVEQEFNLSFHLKHQSNAFLDLIDEKSTSIDPEYLTYTSSPSTESSEIQQVELTQKIIGDSNEIVFVEILLKQGHELSIQKIKESWGENYSLRVERPSLPIGSQCVAEYKTKFSSIQFGFSECEKMNKIVKIRISKEALKN